MKMAKNWLKQMLGRMFRPVSQNDALRIASQSLQNNVQGIRLTCHGTKPAQFRIYANPRQSRAGGLKRRGAMRRAGS
jgi:hypothetical protein